MRGVVEEWGGFFVLTAVPVREIKVLLVALAQDL